MRYKLRVTTVLMIVILFLVFHSLSGLSDIEFVETNEPVLVDKLDGNWSAKWAFKNPDNYTTTNIELSSGAATLQLNKLNFVEHLDPEFRNGTWDGLAVSGGTNLGLDLRRNAYTLIADIDNNRVVEIDYDKWNWQYGSNTSRGFGINQLKRPRFAIRMNANRTLITDTDNHRIIEVGRNREFYWLYGQNGSAGFGDNQMDKPSSAIPMENGNILIADTDNDYVVEVTRGNKRIWQYGYSDWSGGGLSLLARPAYAEELKNGNVLITDTSNHRVVEVTKGKTEVWQYGTGLPGSGFGQLNNPYYATKLDTGNIIIADTGNHRVIEIDQNLGTILWQYGKTGVPGVGSGDLNIPLCAVRLSNGNTLISDSNNHREIEVTKGKNIVWQYGTNGTKGYGDNQLDTPRSGLRIPKDILIGTFASQVIDGEKETNWTTISWSESKPSKTNILLSTRTGDSPSPEAGKWSEWSPVYRDYKGEVITSPMNRYIQYVVFFVTLDPNVTPTIKDVVIHGNRYEGLGQLVTGFFTPSGLLGWNRLTWNCELNGQIIRSYYSVSSTSAWRNVPVGGDLTSVPITTGKIRFKFEISTTNLSISPVLNDFTLNFARLGGLDRIEISPNPVNVSAGEENVFTAVGYDLYGRVLDILPEWSADVGDIENGILTAHTKAATGFVNATASGVAGSAAVNVLPGPLDHIMVTPADVEVIAGEYQAFNAMGYDRYDNILPIEPIWETDVGTMEDNQLKAQNFAGYGIVSAVVDLIEGNANVTVKLNESTHHPPEIISKVPDQLRPEDSEPWMLNLATYESDDEDPGNKLYWFITDVDESLYTVTGAYSEADVLTFIVEPNAFGSDLATLWLTDSDNMTTSQPLWVNITPVNDKPIIGDIPDISIHYEETYIFDYSNYIYDVETSDNGLMLEVIEPRGKKYTAVNGMNVSYNYPESMFGEKIMLTLMVSDGSANAQEIFELTVSDNHAPVLKMQFSDIYMSEGETKQFIFNLDEYFTDQDGDTLSYFFNAQNLAVSVHENHSVSISANTLWSGTETITFRAMDPFGGMAEGHLKVIVAQVNQPPAISPIPEIFVHYDYDYNFNLSQYISDPDNKTRDLAIWTSDEDHIKFQTSDNMLMIMNYPKKLLGQSLWITINVSDGLEMTWAKFRVHVTDNFPPELIKKLADVSFEEDSFLQNVFNLSDHFNDKDGEKLTYSFILNENDEDNITISIDANSSVNFVSKSDWYGESFVIFSAKDHTNAFIQSGLRVVVIPVNDVPEIEPIPVQKGKVGERWVLDVEPYLSDVDNNVTELEIFIDNDLVTVTGKQLTFEADRATRTTIKILVSDHNLNNTGEIELIISGAETAQTQDYMDIILILLVIIAMIIIILTIIVTRKRRGNFVITDAFLIHKSGILVKYKGTTIKGDSDEDIISGMLTAVQSFITDSFAEGTKGENVDWSLNELKMGNRDIMIERGENTLLTVIYKGEPGQRLKEMLSDTLNNIETKYGVILSKWDGNYKYLDGLEEMVSQILTPVQPSKGSIKEPTKPPMLPAQSDQQPIPIIDRTAKLDQTSTLEVKPEKTKQLPSSIQKQLKALPPHKPQEPQQPQESLKPKKSQQSIPVKKQKAPRNQTQNKSQNRNK